ncbi:MAG: hypothetical protein QM582_10570 [Micropruina sp.]|uniref:hypothetical protein n=1 Tax=Micropruina sp. TaxID=2737536 RepID=UPI0039E412EC
MTEPTEPTVPDDREDRAEQAFREGLRQHAEAPLFQPLQPPRPARGRVAMPRWLPLVAAVAVIAAVAVPFAIGRFGGGASTSAVPGAAAEGAPDDTATASRAPTVAARPGWRWESYRVLSYQVPDYWVYAYAPSTDWCSAPPPQPVSRPFVALAPELRATRGILCQRNLPEQQLQMFVTVRAVGATDRGWDLPSGWTATTSKEVAGYLVEVVHTESFAQVAAQIVDSVRPLSGSDPNGCPAQSTLEVGASAATVGRNNLDRVSLCQYDLGVTPAQLVASTLLDRARGRDVAKSLAAAPKGSGPDDRSCTSPGGMAALARLWRGSEVTDVVLRYSGCQGNGIVDASGSRRLTEDACHAVLQEPLVFVSGNGQAAKLCAPSDDVPGAVPSVASSSAVQPSAKPTPSR